MASARPIGGSGDTYKGDRAMSRFSKGWRWRTSRVLVVCLAIVSSGFLALPIQLVASRGGWDAAVSQAADVGPLTVITPTRILDTRASEPPAIQTVGFDAAS